MAEHNVVLAVPDTSSLSYTQDWIVLTEYQNRWSDPGRYWETSITGCTNANCGHVLSQDGNDAHDQDSCLGDKYFIYLQLTK